MAEDIIGIDLGTTNSLVGIVEGGFPLLLADEQGRRLLPSAVAWPGGDAAPVTGHTALNLRATRPDRVVTSVKRLIGRRPGERDWSPPFEVCDLKSGRAGVAVDGRCLEPELVSALILRRLKEIAEYRLDRSVSKAVITVPAYFNDGQRQATMRAGELAGLEVVRIVNEPTAAALACGIDADGGPKRIAVYDLGGGTFDISILDISEGVFQVRSSHGDTLLGGDDVDDALARLLWARAEIATPWDDLPAQARRQLTEAARAAKENLSSAEEAAVTLPFLLDGFHFETVASAADLDTAARPFISRTINHCRLALADAGTEAADLDAVVLVGGSTRLRAVRAAVTEFFGREPDTSQNPDEAVAKGAVLQAGILSGAVRRMVLVDVTPLSLGIETLGGLMNVIIPRNTTIPAKAGEMFTNAVSGQTDMRVRVLQGEREMARDNWELGSFDVAFSPAPRGQARIGVQFSIDENGVLSVLARDTHTHTDRILEIRDTAVKVDDHKVGEMIAGSVDHALEDFHERRWTEARIKAGELLPAVDQALATLGGRLDPAERAAIDAAAAAARAALESGNAIALDQALDELDAATEALAAMLVETALEESLERRLGGANPQ